MSDQRIVQDPATPNDTGNSLPVSELLAPGTMIPSQKHPGGRSIVMDEAPDFAQRRLADERVTRNWELVTVARPIDMHEKVYEVPTKRTVKTYVPKIQVREVLKTIPKDQVEIVEKNVEIPHTKIIDKYVEVPVSSGTEVKYVPRIEVRERTVKVTKPEIKWVEKVIEIPQIKEVVRYIESDKNVEQVIRYVPKGDSLVDESVTENVKSYLEERGLIAPKETQAALAPSDISGSWLSTNASRAIFTPRGVLPLSQTLQPHEVEATGAALISGLSPRSEGSSQIARSPRLEHMEQLFIPRVTKTVEVEKEIPVTVDVPVPFMVPKPVQIPVEVPVIRFRDHFVPVPVRRHVIPRIVFTDEIYEVECIKEKPILVIEDRFKPVPVDLKIKLKEKDIKIIPIDPAEMSQADQHAMWMRVNADLLERARATGKDPRLLKLEEEDKEDNDGNIKDPQGPPDFGPLPLHPGHPLMMTYLQSQWMKNASTVTHNMYTPEFFRFHASALDSVLHPQPHQVNVTHEQSVKLGPLPAQQMPSPWTEIAGEKKSGEKKGKKKKDEAGKTLSEQLETLFTSVPESEENLYVSRSGCSPCSPNSCSL